MENLSVDDIKLLAMAAAGPVVIVVICLIAKGKERWLFVFGWLLLLVIAGAVLTRGRW